MGYGRFGIDEIWAEIDARRTTREQDWTPFLMFFGYLVVVTAIIVCDLLILSI